MLNSIIRTVDVLALAYACGATVWFFFVRFPVLVKRMRRDNFVPLRTSMVAVDGGGKASRLWHRMVVLFVVVMFAGLIPHAVWLVS